MLPKPFYTKLGLITVGTMLLLLAVHFFVAPLQEAQGLSWLSIGFFFSLTVLMYELGRRLAVNPNKNAFTSMVMVFVFVKMLLSIFIIVVYAKVAAPSSKLFVVPFFVVYLIYTIFETYFLMVLGRSKPK